MDRKRIALASGFFCWALVSSAQSPRYNTAKTLPPPTKQEIKEAAERVPLPDDINIPPAWVPYLNPAYNNFWVANGNHFPDPGFVLFARNPTPENARLWLLRMETKANMVNQMWELVETEYASLIKSGVIKDRYGLIKKQITGNLGMTPSSLGDTQIYFLFSKSCPKCEKQAQILSQISSVVMPLQVDAGSLKNFNGLRPSDTADEQTKKDYLKGSVPVLIIANRKAGRIMELTGVQGINAIMKGISDVSKPAH